MYWSMRETLSWIIYAQRLTLGLRGVHKIVREIMKRYSETSHEHFILFSKPSPSMQNKRHFPFFVEVVRNIHHYE